MKIHGWVTRRSCERTRMCVQSVSRLRPSDWTNAVLATQRPRQWLQDKSGCSKKSNPLKLYAVFSAAAWNFGVKFYTFTWLSNVRLTAKRHLLIFQYEAVTDILARPLCDFCALQNVCVKTQQNSITETTRWTMCLMFDSRFLCLNCSPPAFVHLCSRSMQLLTALLIGSCGRLSQITCNNQWLTWVLDGACDRPPTWHPRHGSPWIRQIWRQLVISDEFRAVDLKPFLCDACLLLIAVVEKDNKVLIKFH